MDASLLDRARSGDDAAFEELVAPHRRELLVHCYRSLGSMHDAEDVLQEVLMSAWRGLDRFDGRSLRAWLYRIATEPLPQPPPRRVPPAATGQPLRTRLGGVWTSPAPTTRGGSSPTPMRCSNRPSSAPRPATTPVSPSRLSFVAGLQHLPAQQRSVLVLRDVLGFPAHEAAEILGTTTDIGEQRAGPGPSRLPPGPDARIGSHGPVRRRKPRWSTASSTRSSAATSTASSISSADDARLSMPPEPIQCHGPAAIADFLQQRGFWGPGLKLLPTRANDQPAFVYYLPDPAGHVPRASGVIVLTVVDDHVSTLTRFGGRDIIARFGLPLTLPRTPPK